MGKLDEVYRRSLAQPQEFWAEAAQDVSWQQRWDRVLDGSRAPFYRWFAGGVLNACYNAVDRHVERGRGEQPALIWDSPASGAKALLSYRELQEQVALLAGALRGLGVGHGDRVLVYMPNVPEAVMGMLACARLGAIHAVVFGGFASPELAARIDDAKPRLVLAASCGLEPGRVIAYQPLLEGAIALARHKPERCVYLQREQQRAKLDGRQSLDWLELVDRARPAECVGVPATDPLYILHTSGTTGLPKGVVHDVGGYLVALHWSMRNVYAMQPGETYWAASDIGWAVGHSYIVYGPLVYGCSSVLYEGKPVGTPDAGAFWRVIAEHGVQLLFTAPTAFRAIRRDDPDAEHVRRHDLSRFRALFLAGERADPATIAWAEQALGVPVIDHWWQTETGWPMAANCLGIERLPVVPGSPSRAVPGYDVRVLGEDGREVPRRQTGAICVKLPLPPGALPTLWQNDLAYREKYLARFPGYYETADAGYVDENDYVWIMSRTDDVINVAGHRLSTGAMEEVLAGHAEVAECAVIGVADALKGQLPLGLVVLKSGARRGEAEIVPELVARVRDAIGPVAAFKAAAVVQRLPKTRSGKILRGTMRAIADGESFRVPPTIDDPAILDEIRAALRRLGYANG
jgi:propionyl-CoA synthetase